MDNKTALVLAVLIISVVAADLLYFSWDLHIFLGRQLLRIVEWLAFWR